MILTLPTDLQVGEDIAKRLLRGDPGTRAKAKQFVTEVQDVEALRFVALALLDEKPKRAGRPPKLKPDSEGVYDLDAYIERTPEQGAEDLAELLNMARAIDEVISEKKKGLSTRKLFDIVAPKYSLSAGDLKRTYYEWRSQK
ncbi:hypothetical protein [Xanthomonas axonopodis]